MHKLARSMNKLLIRIPNVRYASGYDLPADIEALFAEPKYNAKFQEEKNRVIHETDEDFAKPMVANLYPGSLAVPKGPEDELGMGDKPTGVWERITFFGDKVRLRYFSSSTHMYADANFHSISLFNCRNRISCSSK